MVTSNFLGDIVSTGLKQLGASVEEIRNGILYIAKLKLAGGIRLTYVFNITKQERYFLQRVEPYPMSCGFFDAPEDIVRFIQGDLKKFRNAERSHNFTHFIEAAQAVQASSQAFEQLFLERNVSKQAMDDIAQAAAALQKTIQEARETCPKLT